MDNDNNQAPSLWDVAKSVMAGFLGVQKSKHYERDFTHGKPWQYITLGLIGVVIFIAVIIGVVRLVLSLAGV
ncbi:MAG: DUF2970 domain-containing protein [Thiohalophilus sp.]|uniref:DUF2970 domain-containing protein n=1 Tax=Thiohalophilus sp. TaxID=3028392 RepID=UPI0028706E61|nr:DUF2970 domain-containing protein [Thiohalophilus sp.]MDR9436327.1 DUF2970 domain-containing protein [Thiohalophilus sp.]